jgi:hypothetical protein
MVAQSGVALPADANRAWRFSGDSPGGLAHDFNRLLGVILTYAAFRAEELAVLGDCPPECVTR